MRDQPRPPDAVDPLCAASLHLLDDSLAALRASYRSVPFFVERDLVWTTQTWLLREVERRDLDVVVRTEHPIEPGPRRALSADIALLTRAGGVLAVVEFKYEPSHDRADMPKSKLPVVEWNAVVRDSARVRRWCSERRCALGLAVFIDEGGHFRRRPAPECAVWQDWPEAGTAGLVTRVVE